MSNKEHVTVQTNGTQTVLRITQPDKTPSWQRYGKGHASIEFSTFKEAPWLSIHAAEYGEKSGKVVMLSIGEEAVRSLYNMLHEKFK